MKRKLLLLSVIAICIAIAATGTLAYFTAEGRAHNVITTGGVHIELLEWADEARTQPFEDQSGILPGASVTKIAEVRNLDGSAEAWIRVRIEKAIRLTGGGTPDLSLVELALNETDWMDGGDGYYYYASPLAPGKTTPPLLTAVTFSRAMGNEYQGATAEVTLIAQAVQRANNGDSALTAAGWPSDEP